MLELKNTTGYVVVQGDNWFLSLTTHIRHIIYWCC